MPKSTVFLADLAVSAFWAHSMADSLVIWFLAWGDLALVKESKALEASLALSLAVLFSACRSFSHTTSIMSSTICSTAKIKARTWCNNIKHVLPSGLADLLWVTGGVLDSNISIFIHGNGIMKTCLENVSIRRSFDSLFNHWVHRFWICKLVIFSFRLAVHRANLLSTGFVGRFFILKLISATPTARLQFVVGRHCSARAWPPRSICVTPLKTLQSIPRLRARARQQ